MVKGGKENLQVLREYHLPEVTCDLFTEAKGISYCQNNCTRSREDVVVRLRDISINLKTHREE